MHIDIIQETIDVIRRKITFRDFKRRFYKFLCGKKIDYYNCNYNEIISLGYNCEVSQRLSDIFKNSNFQHYLYTWSYEHDRILFIESLLNLKNFVDSKYSILSNGMIKHEKYNISFHSRFKKQELFNNGNTYTPKVPIAINELKSRLQYLSEKFLTVLEQKDNILFIAKCPIDNNIEDDTEYIKALNSAISTFFEPRNAHYTLLIILSKKNHSKKYIKQLIRENIKNVEIGMVKSFAKDPYTDIDGDVLGWYKLLKAYIK